MMKVASPSSETQGQLVGTTGFSLAKFTTWKSRRPDLLLGPRGWASPMRRDRHVLGKEWIAPLSSAEAPVSRHQRKTRERERWREKTGARGTMGRGKRQTKPAVTVTQCVQWERVA